MSSHAAAGEDLSVVQLIRAGTLDAKLAALVWLMLEARVPLVVAAAPGLAGKAAVLLALLEFLPPSAAIRYLDGHAEAFAWLPEAIRLGWRASGTGHRDRNDQAPATADRISPATADRISPAAADRISPATGFLVAADLAPHEPRSTWGEQARIAIRALSIGYGLGATIDADSLEELFDQLQAPDVSPTTDELSHLGIVLILRAFPDQHGAAVRRIAAAHYIRPVARDSGGHVQRLRPAVLATWDEGREAFEHFAWGVTPELAMRVGRRAGDFEAELERRRDVLVALSAAGVESVTDVRAAIDGYRLSPATHRH